MNTPRIEIDLKPSVRFGVLLAIMFLVSLAVITYLPLAPVLKIILLIPSIIYCGVIFLQHVMLLNSSSIRKIIIQDGKWQIQTGKGILDAELNKNSTATGTVCVLQFLLQNPKRSQSCILFDDSMSAADYKRLLIYLHS